MADIELVVKIPEELLRYFNSFYLMGVNENKNVDKLVKVIKHGIPLPKGHGELVYREDVCNELRYMDNDGYITRRVYHVIEDIKKGVPTIIEADKEGE